MTMQIPRAGTNPGPAARAVPQPGGGGGQVIDQLGRALSDIGGRLEGDRLDRELKRAQVDMTRDLNDLRLEVEQIGDPDEADRFWVERRDALRDSYLAPDAQGQARISPGNSENFGLAFDDLANRHGFSIGARNLGLRQSQRLATYDAYLFEAERTAVNSDESTRDVLLEQGAEQIRAMVQSGILTPEEGQERLQNLNTRLDEAAAFEAYNSDPAGFLRRLDDGEFHALDPTSETRMRAGAQADLQKAAKEAETTAEQARAEARKGAVASLNRLSSLSDPSRATAAALAMLDDPAILAMAEEDEDVALALRKAQARVSLDAEEQAFATATPAQLRDAINQERQAKVQHPFQEERLQLLEEHLERVESAVETDLMGHLADVGYAVPALDLAADPDALTQQLQRRVGFGEAARDRGFGARAAVLNAEEKTQLSDLLEPGADPARRQDVLTAFAGVLGSDAQPVIEEATGDPMLAHVTHLMTQGASPNIIRLALDGQKRLADKTVNAPKPGAFRASFRAITDDIFFEETELENRVLATATTFYATLDPESDDIDDAKARQAINMALGGAGSDSGGLIRMPDTGLFGRYELPLPPGLAHRDFEAALDDLSAQMQGRPPRGAFAGRDPSAALLSRASLTGSPPALDPEDMAAQFDRLRIQPLWRDGQPSDRYILVRETPQGPVALADTTGARFEFSLRRFVRGARR